MAAWVSALRCEIVQGLWDVIVQPCMLTPRTSSHSREQVLIYHTSIIPVGMVPAIVIASLTTTAPFATPTLFSQSKEWSGDEFSNNLFSDLAPLLTLFGEQVGRMGFSSRRDSQLEY